MDSKICQNKQTTNKNKQLKNQPKINITQTNQRKTKQNTQKTTQTPTTKPQKQPQNQTKTFPKNVGCCKCKRCIRVQGKNGEVIEGRGTKEYETKNHKQLRKSLELKIAGG